MVLGLGALYFFLVFFNIAGEFLVNTAGFALPAYYSLDALFSVSPTDDVQWLTVSTSLSRAGNSEREANVYSTGSSTLS